jgi:predicted transcriptional regulator
VIVNTEETNPHSTAMIVSSYVRHHTLGPEQLSDLITTVHHALSHLGQPMRKF